MKSLLQGLVGGVLGGGLTFLVFQTIRLPRFDLEKAEGLLLLALLVPMFLIVVAVHEAGHLLAGAAQRFRPALFIVGPLKLERRGRVWSAGINRSVSMFGGMAVGIPEGAARIRQRMLVLIAGGPAASLVAGAAGLLVLLDQYPAQPARVTLSGSDATLYLAILMFTVMSLAIGGIALLPTRTGGYDSDGAQLLKFRRSTPEVEAEVAAITLSTSSLGGTRPREWDAGLLERALALPPQNARGVLVRLLAHLHALDTGDVDSARAYLQEALANSEHTTRLGRPSLLVHAAQFAALTDRDPAPARQYLHEAGDGTFAGVHSLKFAEAAVLHVEGAAGVEERLAEAEAAAADALDRGGVLLLLDRIAELRRVRGMRVGSEPPPGADTARPR
jgi:membrane-associated protease RseP (regulator of RpoE activity)